MKLDPLACDRAERLAGWTTRLPHQGCNTLGLDGRGGQDRGGTERVVKPPLRGKDRRERVNYDKVQPAGLLRRHREPLLVVWTEASKTVVALWGCDRSSQDMRGLDPRLASRKFCLAISSRRLGLTSVRGLGLGK